MTYDPRADIVFRKIFCEHDNLCISLLNALLPLADDEKVTEIEYLDPNMFPEYVDDKHSIVDVRCRDQKGRHYIVEMQMHWTEEFLMRALFNASKAFTAQSQPGMNFKELRPVYALCLLNENMPDAREYHDEYTHTYIIRHELHKELTIGGMKFVFVELKKFHSHNRAYNKMAELWMSFLTCMEGKRVTEEPEIPAALTANPDISQAIDCLRTMSMTPAERYAYEKYWDAVSCERTLLEGKYAEGMAEGMAKGIAQGIAKGQVEGERKHAIETAQRMLAVDMSIDMIAQLTGLTAEEVNALR